MESDSTKMNDETMLPGTPSQSASQSQYPPPPGYDASQGMPPPQPMMMQQQPMMVQQQPMMVQQQQQPDPAMVMMASGRGGMMMGQQQMAMAAMTAQNQQQALANIQWAAKPNYNDPNIPPGIEYVIPLDTIVIQQQFNMMEMMTGLNMPNKYSVQNAVGQQLFAIEEQCGVSLGNRAAERSTTLPLVDYTGQTLIQIHRVGVQNGTFFSCNFTCGCCSDMVDELYVQCPVGNRIGNIGYRKINGCFCYVIKDRNDQDVVYIKGTGSICQTGYSQVQPATLPIHSFTNDVEIGSCYRAPGIPGADKWTITMPMDLAAEVKLGLLAGTICYDIVFYDRLIRANNNNRRRH